MWVTLCFIFLGILLDGEHLFLVIPMDKRLRAQGMIERFPHKKKATVRELQELCWYLNFLCKAIFPRRVFLRQMYVKYVTVVELKPHNLCHAKSQLKKKHHIKLDSEFKLDCLVWKSFLDSNSPSLVTALFTKLPAL